MKTVSGFSEQFGQRNEGNGTSKLEVARSYRRLAHLHLAVGDRESALSAFERSLALFEDFNSTHPSKADYDTYMVALLFKAWAIDKQNGIATCRGAIEILSDPEGAFARFWIWAT